MAEDHYRLAPVRDARARDERVRRGELAGAVGDAKHTEAQLSAAQARTAAARAAVAQATATATAALETATARARDLVVAERHLARLRHTVELAIADELRAQAAHDARLGHVDAARLVLARSRADREVIERHFARWRDDKKKLAERRED